MSEFTNFSDADLIDTFGRLRATGVDPERCQRARDALSSRLRARSVEGLVEAIREHVYYDTPEDHFVDPSIPLVGFEYVEDAILHWGGDTDGD